VDIQPYIFGVTGPNLSNLVGYQRMSSITWVISH